MSRGRVGVRILAWAAVSFATFGCGDDDGQTDPTSFSVMPGQVIQYEVTSESSIRHVSLGTLRSIKESLAGTFEVVALSIDRDPNAIFSLSIRNLELWSRNIHIEANDGAIYAITVSGGGAVFAAPLRIGDTVVGVHGGGPWSVDNLGVPSFDRLKLCGGSSDPIPLCDDIDDGLLDGYVVTLFARAKSTRRGADGIRVN